MQHEADDHRRHPHQGRLETVGERSRRLDQRNPAAEVKQIGRSLHICALAPRHCSGSEPTLTATPRRRRKPLRALQCPSCIPRDAGLDHYGRDVVAALLASPLPSMSASVIRASEAGTRAFMMRFSRPGTILERFLSRPLRPSDTHCSTLIGFIGMFFGSKPNFSSTAVFVNPAASTVT